MRFARKLALLALAAVAAMALAATPASATDPIEIVDENGICGDLASGHTSGGCNVHATGTVELEARIFGFWVEEDTCDVELEMRVSGDGVAAVYYLEHYAIEAGTSVQECENETPVTMCDSPWEGSGEESAPGVVRGSAAVCIDSDELDICGQTLGFDIVGSENNYSVTFDHELIGSNCRITGTLQVESAAEGNSDIHINHL